MMTCAVSKCRVVGGNLDGRVIEMPDDWQTIIIPYYGPRGMVYPMFRREKHGGETVLVEVTDV